MDVSISLLWLCAAYLQKLHFTMNGWIEKIFFAIHLRLLFVGLKYKCLMINKAIAPIWILKHYVDCGSIGSDNGLVPTRRQAIVWINNGYIVDAYMILTASALCIKYYFIISVFMMSPPQRRWLKKLRKSERRFIIPMGLKHLCPIKHSFVRY